MTANLSQTEHLQLALCRFKNSKEGIRKRYEETKSLVGLSAEIVCGKDEAAQKQFTEAIITQEDTEQLEKIISVEKESMPSLVVVGQTKSGKSTLINELLGGTFVAQAPTPCTARVTRLTYSDESYVKVVSSEGEILHHRKLKKRAIPEELLSLKNENRDDAKQVSATVEAGVKSAFLQAGVDVIDSPGRNENPALDALSIKVMNSLIPLIIYVIDGRQLLTMKDIADIRDIRAKTFGVEIFYVVSKLDMESNSIEVQSLSHPAEFEELERQLMMEKMEKVYKRLVEENFLPNTVPMEECPLFHSLSLWKVRQWRKSKNRPPQNHWIDRFNRLKKEIHDFAEVIMAENIRNSTGILLRCHTRLGDNFFRRSTSINENTAEIKSCIEYLGNVGEELHAAAIGDLEDRKKQLETDMGKFLAAEKIRIYDCVQHVEYDAINMQSGIMVSDNTPFLFPSDNISVVDRCRHTIHTSVFATLNQALEKFVREELLQNYEQLMKKFMDKLDEAEESLRKNSEHENDAVKTRNFENYARLKQVILECHNLNQMQVSLLGQFIRALKTIYRTVRNALLHPIRTLTGDVPVNDARWKQEEAENVLFYIEENRLSDLLYNSLDAHFMTQRERVSTETKNAIILLELGEKLNRDKLEELQGLKVKSQMVILGCESIYGKYILKDVDVDYESLVGEGVASRVHRCHYTSMQHQTVEVVIKQCRVNGQWLKKYRTFRDLYNAGFVKLHGFETTDEDESGSECDYICINLLMDKQPTNLLDFLKKMALRPPATLKLRMRIGLQVAVALCVLHNHDIAHGGIHMRNVFMEEDGLPVYLSEPNVDIPYDARVYLSPDFHFAPEWVAAGLRPQEASTDRRPGDIFSLAMLIWLLFEGSAVKPPHHAQMAANGRMVLRNMESMHLRPQKLPNMSHQLWRLLNEAWVEEPFQRITIGEFVSKLQLIVHDMVT